MALRNLASMLVCIAALLGLVTPHAVAGLTGSAELRYARQETSEQGDKVVDASHFAQQYSLLYQTNGQFLGGRGGKYALGVGYEWNSLDAEINGESADIQTGKILYKGDILIAQIGRAHV